MIDIKEIAEQIRIRSVNSTGEREYNNLFANNLLAEMWLKQHSDLINKFGNSLYKTINITTKSDALADVEIVKKLEDLFLKQFDLRMHFFYPPFPSSEQLRHRIIGNRKVSTLIEKIIEKNKPKIMTEDFINFKNNVSNVLTELAESIKVNSTESTVEVVITIDPIDFLNIGHYEIDYQSCFRDGRCNQFNKYNLMACKDSFLVLLKQNDKVITRFLGFYHPSAITFSNFYGLLTTSLTKKAMEEIVEYFTEDSIKNFRVFNHVFNSSNCFYLNNRATQSVKTYTKDASLFGVELQVDTNLIQQNYICASRQIVKFF